MPSPFPGMDPWLEHPLLWPGVHNSLIAALADHLSPLLLPRYVVRLEERAYLAEPGQILVGLPDLSLHGPGGRRPARVPAPTGGMLAVEVPVTDRVRETWLEVRTPVRGQRGEVVTVVELLSPTNKQEGEGGSLYLEKRSAVLGTRTSLVEIDLVRAGAPMPVHGANGASGYRILVSRGDRRPGADLHVFSMREPIPKFALPLRPGDDEPVVDLGAILARLYDRAGYGLSVDYGRRPVPPLSTGDRAWARGVVARRRKRPRK